MSDIPPPAPDEGDESRRTGITELLGEASGGNVQALNRLLPMVYDDLRRIARARLRSERDGHTLNTTALVHEAYLRLVDQTRVNWRGRSHFYGVASEAMRRILVNHALAARAARRGGGATHLHLDDDLPALSAHEIDDLLALDQALGRLETFNPRGARVVVCRYFGGLSYDEIAEDLGTSVVTVRRAWAAARAWLRAELGDAAIAMGTGAEARG